MPANTPFFIDGPAGPIEAVLDGPSDPDAVPPAIGIVCHPHSLHGGTLQNKVVYMVARAFVQRGLPTLRFNFRGVGRSAGVFDAGRGEGEDLAAVAAWLRQRYPALPLWLGGFSFGSYVAYRAHRAIEAARLLQVAPPVGLFDFGTPVPVAVPWLVVQGDADEIVDPRAVRDWVAAQPTPPAYVELADAGHFFHGRLNDLRGSVSRWLTDRDE